MIGSLVVLGMIVAGLLIAWQLRAEPAPAPSLPPPAPAPPLGGYHDMQLLGLPPYVRPGHGFLVLRDRVLDRLVIDGLDVGDPEAQEHPFFTGSFRGYFNVPPGKHVLVAYYQGRESTWTVDVAPNAAYVRRMDWGEGGWADDTPETQAHYVALARSGSMLQAKALRPWPLVSLYFQGPPPGLTVDGSDAGAQAPFSGVVNLRPGAHRVVAGEFTVEVELPPEGMSVIDFQSDPPSLVDPRIADLVVRTMLSRVPLGALVSADQLAPPATLETIPAPSQAGSGGGVRQFGDAELAALERAFAAWRAQPGPETLAQYIAVLRTHYIIDREMAKQAPYFTRYGEAIVRHLRERPDLRTTAAASQLRYLAQDLIDTEVESCSACGRTLQDLVGS